MQDTAEESESKSQVMQTFLRRVRPAAWVGADTAVGFTEKPCLEKSKQKKKKKKLLKKKKK